MDWVGDNLYWVEEEANGLGKVVVAKGDGRYKRSLVTDVSSPTSIAVDPQRGRMFWASSGKNSQHSIIKWPK